jgi:glycosyltransferase involved in cell wall biosynthesis
MKIYGFMIAKNESDIIQQTLDSLVKYGCFDKIFVFDNNSTDKTYELAKKFQSTKVEVSTISNHFSDQLKFDLVNSKKDIFNNDTWITTLDADEIYYKSLKENIEIAASENSNCIEHNTVQFYLTDSHINNIFDVRKSAIEQIDRYLLNYGELRIFKYFDGNVLTAEKTKSRDCFFRPSSTNFPVLHFQYRSSIQIDNRNLIRLENNVHSNNWGHVKTQTWKDYVVPARYLHKYDGDIKVGLPVGTNLYKVKNNPAYTMANLKWMQRHGHLTKEQEEFFTSTRLKKIWMKYA